MSSFMEKIKAQNFKEINKSEITADDINEFALNYKEILDLKEKYNNAVIGRKEIANEIREKLVPLNIFLNYLTNRTNALDSDYEFAEQFVSDYKMAMNLLLKLANENGDKFILKRFLATSFASFEKKHGDREHKQIGGNVWVIGEKIVLDEIDEKKLYFGSEFGEIANNIVKNSHSLIILTDHYYENNVKPSTFASNKFQEININVTNEMVRDISCYLYDGNLKNAVNKFMAFINQNGADIKGIDENQLFDIMKTGNINSDKKKTKNLILKEQN